MYCWRVTKYNPINRDLNGVYLKEEWTSYSDIGKIFEGKKIIAEDYLKIEKAYTQSIALFMDCLKLDHLYIVDLQKNVRPEENEWYSSSLVEAYDFFNKKQSISKKEVELIAILALRENIWCKLESTDMYVHFGYDYYLYIGSKNQCDNAIHEIEKLGLFIENFASPYS